MMLRPLFCLVFQVHFTSVLHSQKAQYKLYVNLCQWKRIPHQKDWTDPVIPVKGGVLRHVVENGKKQPNDLLVDIAFNPCLVEHCKADRAVMDRLVTLSLNFIDDFLSILTDRNTQILPELYKGPLEDISHSIDEHQAELLPRECWLDMEESILSSIKRGKRVRPMRKGVYIHVCSCIFEQGYSSLFKIPLTLQTPEISAYFCMSQGQGCIHCT